MKRRTFAELTGGDPRTLRLVAGAFDTERVARVEYAVERLQDQMQAATLRSDVSPDVRARFEMVQLAYVCAVFGYELFSVAEAYAHLLYEMTVGERFVELYEHRIPLMHRPSGERLVVEVARFGDLWRALNQGAYRHWLFDPSHGGWALEGHARFRGSLPELLGWAHSGGLLRRWLEYEWERVGAGVRFSAMSTFGDERRIPDEYAAWSERDRRRWWATFRDAWYIERLDHLAAGRHLVAHPEGVGLHGPSTFAIHDLARFINSLWSKTPKVHR